MFKSLTLFLGKLFFKSPVAHHFSPTLVNINFSNSKNINPVILNLKNVSSVKFVISLRKGENIADEHILSTIIDGERNIEIGVFESKKEAEEALMLLNIKISSLSKFIAKWFAIIIFTLVCLMFAKDMFLMWSMSQKEFQNKVVHSQSTKSEEKSSVDKDSIQIKSPITPKDNDVIDNSLQVPPAGPVLSDAELLNLFNEAQKISQSQDGNGNPIAIEQNQSNGQENLSAADMFIKGLK